MLHGRALLSTTSVLFISLAPAQHCAAGRAPPRRGCRLQASGRHPLAIHKDGVITGTHRATWRVLLGALLPLGAAAWFVSHAPTGPNRAPVLLRDSRDTAFVVGATSSLTPTAPVRDA